MSVERRVTRQVNTVLRRRDGEGRARRRPHRHGIGLRDGCRPRAEGCSVPHIRRPGVQCPERWPGRCDRREVALHVQAGHGRQWACGCRSARPAVGGGSGSALGARCTRRGMCRRSAGSRSCARRRCPCSTAAGVTTGMSIIDIGAGASPLPVIWWRAGSPM